MSTPLLLHVVGGFAALLAMIVAYAMKKGSRWHKLAGKSYVAAMAVSLVMGLLLSVQNRDLFLGMISIFSAYFVYTGWRLAARKGPEVIVWDKLIVFSLMVVGIGMVLYGTWMLMGSDGQGVVMVVFGLTSILFGSGDLKNLKGWPTGKERIRMHLARMGGASIATLTAPTVVNIRTEPEFIAWLAPGVLMTPLLTYWGRRVSQGKMSLRD